jgi:hypothetical protein
MPGDPVPRLLLWSRVSTTLLDGRPVAHDNPGRAQAVNGKLRGCEITVKRTKPSAFQQPLGPSVARFSRSSSFFVNGKSYKGWKVPGMCFQCFKDGTLLALVEDRRSGAQRGASENNFGQRFSVSTPCFTLSQRPALPGFFRAYLPFPNYPLTFVIPSVSEESASCRFRGGAFSLKAGCFRVQSLFVDEMLKGGAFAPRNGLFRVEGFSPGRERPDPERQSPLAAAAWPRHPASAARRRTAPSQCGPSR